MPTLLDARPNTRTHVVHDGVEALDFLFCRNTYASRSPDVPPDVVLLDIKLPKINGLEVLRQIKSNERTRAIPVVMLTSSAVDRDLVEAYAGGANSYIQKPVDFERLHTTLATIAAYWLDLNAMPAARPFNADSQ